MVNKIVKYLIVVLLMMLVFFIGYKYLYKEHRDIESESVEYKVTVESIFNDFIKDEITANSKYADKTIEVEGIVTDLDINNNILIIDGKLYASFIKENISNVAIGQKVKIKGRFVGFDNLIEEIKMDQCKILN